jgi:hypothetical protein
MRGERPMRRIHAHHTTVRERAAIPITEDDVTFDLERRIAA